MSTNRNFKDIALNVVINRLRKVLPNTSWKLKDKVYASNAKLGLTWNDNKAILKFWSPSADLVSVIIYDEEENYLDTFEMQYDRGVWTWSSEQDLKNKYYQLKIKRTNKEIYVLDPYAKSMAPWNGLDLDEIDRTNKDHVAKAAFVDPSDFQNQTAYADIKGYEDREDAIIYEMHIRDFTSDPFIEKDLNNKRFGTFDAFIEKLDYVKDLGVTHIQLLPIMSYFIINELDNERYMDPTLQGKASNYNWGYDPHSYFSISGVYSSDVKDPSLRIKEFKQLVDEIHLRGMGVILDVVYNHTASTHILEDLEPGYYHFMDKKGEAKTSFGGGRLASTHKMARKLLIDSLTYFTEEFMIDGFRFDMMGDHDAASIQEAYNECQKINPNILFIGEGWISYEGDDAIEKPQAADQSWMDKTSDVGVFSDDLRNMMKSGFPSEGSPEFLSGGPQNIQKLFDNIKAQPHNFYADEPKDVVTYLEAHDNLTLHDVIAIAIKKDPQKYQKEILKRIRLGSLVMMTSQGTMFIHAGQEYGRTRQVFADKKQVLKMDKLYILDDATIEYPYFIADAYNTSDGINRFDWDKTLNQKENVKTREYLRGLIAFRKEANVFRLKSRSEVDQKIKLLQSSSIKETDLVIAYKAIDEHHTYYVLINADDKSRDLVFDEKIITALKDGLLIADKDKVNKDGITNPNGFVLTSNKIIIDALTGIIVKYRH